MSQVSEPIRITKELLNQILANQKLLELIEKEIVKWRKQLDNKELAPAHSADIQWILFYLEQLVEDSKK